MYKNKFKEKINQLLILKIPSDILPDDYYLDNRMDYKKFKFIKIKKKK